MLVDRHQDAAAPISGGCKPPADPYYINWLFFLADLSPAPARLYDFNAVLDIASRVYHPTKLMRQYHGTSILEITIRLVHLDAWNRGLCPSYKALCYH